VFYVRAFSIFNLPPSPVRAVRLQCRFGFLRALFFTLGSATALGVVACGGGGGGSTLPVAQATATATGVATNPPGQSPNAKTTSVTFSVRWTKPGSTAARLKREYLSNSTTTVTIAVNGGETSSIANPYLTPGAVTPPGPTQTTSISFAAPLGNDSFAIQALDSKSRLLGAATVVQTIVIDKANTVTATLNGNLYQIAVAAVSSPYVSEEPTASPATFAIVGQAPEDFVVTPEDADGNVIVSPGTIPAITLTSGSPASVSVAATNTANEFAVQSHLSGAAIALTAAGTNLAGSPVSTPFDIITEAAIYVVNHGIAGPNGLASPESVSIYNESATADQAPLVTLSGSNTKEVGIQFPAVDANGVLYLSNQGPLPGTNFSPTSGYISIFDGAAQIASGAAGGNIAPTAIIAGLSRPEGLAIDGSGDLWAMLERSIVEYPPSPAGASTPIATIGAPNPTPASPAPTNNTGIDGCYGVAVDTNGQVYGACSGAILAFAKGSVGNVKPTLEIEPAGDTAETFASDSWLSVATDASDNIYAPDANNNLNMVTEYAAGANDGTDLPALPGFEATGTGFSIPWGIAIDQTLGDIYVTNYASSTLEIFGSSSVLETGVPSITLTNGINSPFGVAVR
jgi:hypothetical protein